MKEGQSSEAVDRLNQFLSALGYQTTGDTFDQTTVSAVQAVQQKAELEVTGKVNAETAQAIEKAVTDQLKQEDHAYLKAVELLSK